ncbi:MAG TPA: aromatic aminobenezylarsenical efflux permease ArsG family transporter [Bacteroidales bacterium]|jgi:sulfite exporter TauE/SafE|nr:aromatic aminobenezylarsenical efflux permease ArsG family transporter [Bacteroidales bacterium]HPE43100.1 aromatic aminobenezylarsenical efflux permease ArsG family transporter [Bacteroidales bacterium]
MDFLQSLLDNTSLPFLTALLLGLMTAISPCPLATNITAIAFISKDMENRRKVFFNGLIYTLGRAISYTAIGVVLFFGASTFSVAGFFQQWGERLLGPLLLIIGIFMLDNIRINFPGLGKLGDKMEQNPKKGFWQVLLLGIVFALAFCPYSGLLYFGMLIPITIASPSGLFLPMIFAVATGLPVIVLAWMLAFTMSEVGSFYNKLKTFEKWFRKVIAVVFILVGLYYIFIFFIP